MIPICGETAGLNVVLVAECRATSVISYRAAIANLFGVRRNMIPRCTLKALRAAALADGRQIAVTRVHF
jgi:hypothetical protein